MAKELTKQPTAKDLRGGVDQRGSEPGEWGNPPHQFSEEISNKVRMLRALGNSHETIAFACNVSPDTLTKYYKAELELGKLEANLRVGAAIFQSALGEQVPCLECEDGKDGHGKRCKDCHGTGKVWRLEPNTTAQIWWSKNQMGWTDQQRIEHTGPDGGPIITEQRDAGRSIQTRLAAIRERQQESGGK